MSGRGRAARGLLASAVAAGAARRQAAGAEGDPGRSFVVRQHRPSPGDGFWIEDGRGDRVLRVGCRLVRARTSLVFEDALGREIYRATDRISDRGETLAVRRTAGGTAAVVRSALFSPTRHRWMVAVPGEQDLLADGNVLQREYTLRPAESGPPLATVSKHRLRLRDSFGVAVAAGADVSLVLTLVVVIDVMSHHGEPNVPHGGVTEIP